MNPGGGYNAFGAQSGAQHRQANTRRTGGFDDGSGFLKSGIGDYRDKTSGPNRDYTQTNLRNPTGPRPSGLDEAEYEDDYQDEDEDEDEEDDYQDEDEEEEENENEGEDEVEYEDDDEDVSENEDEETGRRYGDERPSLGVSGSAYVELESHEIFKRAKVRDLAVLQKDKYETWRPRLAVNLIACDGLGRLYVWDSDQRQLQYVEIQRSDFLNATDHESVTLLASKNFQTIQLSTPVEFQVLRLAFNRTGRSLVLAGDGGLVVVNLLGAGSTTSGGICSVQKVGGERVFRQEDGYWLRILQIEWHPHSDTHLGVLSSDGCFRLFDLSLDAESAEQEYYLHPRSSTGGTGSTTLVRPIAFAFGGEHLWDRFTVFVLYNDGSLFALCPVVPFSSVFSATAIDELAKDARQMELVRPNVQVSLENATIALAWLEAVFPDLSTFTNGANSAESLRGPVMLAAHAYVPVDASLLLQGPLPTLSKRLPGDGVGFTEDVNGTAGQAVGLLYNVIGRDSILAVSTRGGQVRVYVLADEMQPTWTTGKPPQLTVDDEGHILGVGMLVEESSTGEFSSEQQPGGRTEHTSGSLWAGRTPPLLQLAVIDLALQPHVIDAGPMVLLQDPVVPERLYCQHAGGLDAILLRWLPFSAQNDNSKKALLEAPPPAVFSVLEICPTGSTSPMSPIGIALPLDNLGESWVVALTANCDCAVVNMKPHWTLPEPLVLAGESKEEKDSGALQVGVFQVMSKDLLIGPKDFPISQLTSSGPPLTVETLEGRTFLHDQCKLLREQYIEYAHRVHVELTSHGVRLRDIVLEQQQVVKKAEDKLRNSQKSNALSNRIEQAILKNQELERRVRLCSTLPGVSAKPLTVSEREFKAQLDSMRLQDLDILTSAVEVLSVRSDRFAAAETDFSHKSSPKGSPAGRNKVAIPDSQMCRLKQAVEHLTEVVEESSMKVKVIDESVSQRELLKDR